MTLLHKSERRLTAEDVLSVDEPIIRLFNAANYSSTFSSASIRIHRLESSKFGTKFAKTRLWPQCAELFAFSPMTAAVVQHQQQHREKRRGSPSKQISVQHRQQPELEWVMIGTARDCCVS
uniref:Uncharacterized protein n=1 Tax=Globodera rostochiensis TaxID=31243 RepID=A0A914HH10_GLORO